jgi:serine/threonine protein kinase
MARVVDNTEGVGLTSTSLGPVAWMAPESIATNVYSKKSDVWSFGVVVWECVTQQVPHSGVSLLDLAMKIRDVCATPTIPDTMPEALKKLCNDCWQKGKHPAHLVSIFC